MDLETTYLGIRLAHPVVPGASPLADDLDGVRRLEDAGAPAIILRSLFEEQIVREQMAEYMLLDAVADSSAEATSYFPSGEVFALGTDRYLEHLRQVKAAVAVPVIASLNGTTAGGWLEYGQLMQQAGADALELNMYRIATDPAISSVEIEEQTADIVRELKATLDIPVAVKLSPFYTSLPHVARQLTEAGADGLVLFNRFYQPDFDVEELTVSHALHLSDSSELLLRLHWVAILSGRIDASLAVTGGVHTALDVVKATMAGADVTQMVSALLRFGPGHLRTVLDDLAAWMEQHEWHTLSDMRGNMSLLKVENPEAYERTNYMLMLQGWRVRDTAS